MESSPLLSATEHAQNTANGKSGTTLANIRVLQEIMSRFKAVHVDPAEFACLKAVVLFKPGMIFIIMRDEFLNLAYTTYMIHDD